MNQISVATEHLATANTEMLFGTIYEQISFPEHRNRKVVVSCTPNEYHQIGGRMVADIFEMNGWETSFLGANTPPSALLSMIEEKKPDLVALSLTVYFGMSELFLLIEKIRERFPMLPLLVGGQAFRHQTDIDFFGKTPKVRQISDLKELDAWCEHGNL
jgi:methanogenic corrinoid protein MtbC1